MLGRLGGRFYRFWWGTGLADDVPALTYYLVLSLAPFALGIAALEALLLDDYVSAVEVADEINRYLPEDIHSDIIRLITGTRDNSPLLIIVAVAAMLWTTSGAIGVVERCVSRILGAQRHSIVLGRIRNMALGALVALLIIAASGGGSVVSGTADIFGIGSTVPGSVVLASNVVGATILFAIIYRTAPLGHLHWRSALVGAFPAAVGLQAIPTLVGFYVQAGAGYAAVRLFLLLAVILLGLYAMATVILVGAGLAAKAERRGFARTTPA